MDINIKDEISELFDKSEEEILNERDLNRIAELIGKAIAEELINAGIFDRT